MKKYYRNRLILGAMLSFLVVLAMAVTGIWLFSYRQMERETNTFLQAMQGIEDENGQPDSQSAAPPMFGYTPDPRRYPSGFYDITTDADGVITAIEQRGIIEEAGINVQQVVQQAAAEKRSGGKIGSYKYSIRYRGDGTARIILLDISIQLQALYNTLKSALLVGGILMAVLFLVLLPISGRVANAFVRNSEKQKRFITDAGHDLKTPVAIIRSNLDVMELLQGKNKWSDNIRAQAERLERLIGELLMMARLDETGDAVSPEPVDLAALLREEAQHFLPGAAEREITLRTEMPENLPMTGDPKSLRQMTNLLLDNAVRYTQKGGEILLTASAEKQKIRLTFSNTVEKLPDLKPEELTERFVRGNTARTQQSGGSGIGLSAAKRIAEMHRGTLEVRYQGEHTFCVSVLLHSQMNNGKKSRR